MPKYAHYLTVGLTPNRPSSRRCFLIKNMGDWIMTDEAQFNKDLGSLVRRMRILRGMPLTKLGPMVGVSSQQLQKYETGECGISIYRLEKLCCVFEILMSDFLNKISSKEYKLTTQPDFIKSLSNSELLNLLQRVSKELLQHNS